MKSRLSGALILLLFSTTSGVVLKQYQTMWLNYNWSDAQSFCRSYSGDLATIYTQPDMDSLWFGGYVAWIGLYKDSNNEWHWVWPDGTPYNWNNWAPNEPGQYDDCAVVSFDNQKYYGLSCADSAFFFCETYAPGSNYNFIPEIMTWYDAQKYCQNNGYLANFDNFDNNDLVNTVHYQDFPVWIGLHREGGSWSWSSGISEYTMWNPGEPSNNGDCVSIGSWVKNMATQNCGAQIPFVCMSEYVFLVKENKSWEEALEYCRGLTSTINSNLHYDLLSLQPGDQQLYVVAKIIEASTDEVWTGLRFLAGEWLWVNGENVLYTDLPIYPALEQHCGVISKNNSVSLEARDCLERKNFLCYVF